MTIGASFSADFHTAVGQFINYRSVLRREDPDRILYLAVPLSVYIQFFVGKFAQMVIEDEGLKLLVFDVDKEVIVEWIE